MDGKTRVCGLIGNPVEHSMSPLMHNYYIERTGTNLVYAPFHVENDKVGDAVRGAFALGILGLNVTVPHKQAVMEYLADIDEDARAIGAVNTLVYTEHGYKGYNTDGAGFKRSLDTAGISTGGQDCIMLGAGGAAKAVAYTLAKYGANIIYLLNRSLEKAESLAAYINQVFGREVVVPLALSDFVAIPFKEKGYLAVQTTSVGMHPNVNAAVVEEEAFYRLIHTGVDIVYTPARTRFMKLVEAAGGWAMNGLDMLLYQGIISYELWNPGVKVDKETIGAARRMILERLSPGAEARPEPAVAPHTGNLILIGFMGAGKTSVAEAYAAACHMPLIDIDSEIEREAGMAISDIFASRGEVGFREAETEALRKLLSTARDSVISVGGGLPMREENRALLRQLGTVVYLDVSPETVYERIGADVSDRPMLHSDNVPERIRQLLGYRRPFYLEASHLSVDVNDRTIEEIVGEIRSLCQAPARSFESGPALLGKPTGK